MEIAKAKTHKHSHTKLKSKESLNQLKGANSISLNYLLNPGLCLHNVTDWFYWIWHQFIRLSPLGNSLILRDDKEFLCRKTLGTGCEMLRKRLSSAISCHLHFFLPFLSSSVSVGGYSVWIKGIKVLPIHSIKKKTKKLEIFQFLHHFLQAFHYPGNCKGHFHSHRVDLINILYLKCISF